VITFVTIPKPFAGRLGTIQYNAIGSWTRVADAVRVILAGDEPGVAEAASSLGVEHEPALECNEHGTPLVSGALRIARERATEGSICFVNTDILLPPALADATRIVRGFADRYVIIGECSDARVDVALDAGSLDWAALRRGSRRRGADAIDYFVFTPDLFSDIPPFAVGRPAWDNWLIWRARSDGVLVVDASAVVKPIHQSHEYDHLGGVAQRFSGPEALENRRLAGGGRRRLYSRFDATHRLTRRGLVRNPLAIAHAGETTRRAWAKVGYTLGFRRT
jgi:hypothetical protein